MLNLSVLLEDSARKRPTKDAFIFMDKHFNFAQINGAANQIANGLKSLGIQKGDKVAINCLNLPYFPMVYFGILKAGAVVVPLSVLLKKDEVAYHLRDSQAKAVFCFEGTPELPMLQETYSGFKEIDTCEHCIAITANPAAASPIEGIKTLGTVMQGQSPVAESVLCDPNDTAVIIYTSGTTGKPKGAELSHSNLLQNAFVSANLVHTKADDTQLIVLPLFHIFAMTCLMNAGVFTGATSVLLPRFEGEAVTGLMLKHKVSIFAGVPTMYWGLLNYDLGNDKVKMISENLRVCLSGGAALPVKVLEDFEAKYQVPVLEGYGMSEGSPVVTFNHLDHERKPGSVGTPAWGVEVMIVDENGNEMPIGEKGELIYRGHNVMKGYFNKPEANAKTLKNGWLYSGDIAIKDKEGFFFIVDRTKDMIIRGGLNVYPREVEEVMAKHPAVSLVAVVGVPDNKMGEEIMACVVLHANQKISETELIHWTKEKIAAYKYPRLVKFLDALPMSATGKILKKEIRKMDLV